MSMSFPSQLNNSDAVHGEHRFLHQTTENREYVSIQFRVIMVSSIYTASSIAICSICYFLSLSLSCTTPVFDFPCCELCFYYIQGPPVLVALHLSVAMVTYSWILIARIIFLVVSIVFFSQSKYQSL